MHAIEPNDEQDGTMTAKGKPWRSFYWDTEDGDKINGSFASRVRRSAVLGRAWDAIGGDTYGTSPGMEALPDLASSSFSRSARPTRPPFLVKPEKIVPSTLKLTGRRATSSRWRRSTRIRSSSLTRSRRHLSAIVEDIRALH
jgi:hypothetical protein